MTEYFAINAEDVVRERLSSIVDCMRVDQAAQFALYQFQYSIPSKSRYVGGLPKKTARPRWDATTTKIVAPDRAIVKTELEKLLKQKGERHLRDGDVKYRTFVDQFESKCDEWSHVTSSSPTWLVEWAGKDVLISLCRWLAAEFGIATSADRPRTRVDWGLLAEEKNADGSPGMKDQETERFIIHELQPKLVNKFLESLETTVSDAQREWRSLASAIAEAASTRTI